MFVDLQSVLTQKQGYRAWRLWRFIAVLVCVQNEKEFLFEGRIFFFTNRRSYIAEKYAWKYLMLRSWEPLRIYVIWHYCIWLAALPCERCLPFDGTLEPCWDLPTEPFVLEVFCLEISLKSVARKLWKSHKITCGVCVCVRLLIAWMLVYVEGSVLWGMYFYP